MYNLPTKCTNWGKLESWGVCRGEQTNPLFVSCTLPEGWSVRDTHPPIGSELRDADGLLRALIFHIGILSHDRKPHINVFTDRYVVSHNCNIKRGKTYEIYDLATKTTVKQYPIGYWGYIVENGEKVGGLIYNELFYYKPIADRFSSVCSADQAIQITFKDFFNYFYWSEGGYFSAAEHTTKQQALEECEHMSKESGW